MIRTDAINGAALALTVCAAALGGGISTGRGTPMIGRAPELTSSVHAEKRGDGTSFLRDATGAEIPLKHYTRIASGTLIADRVLADLCEPDRIVAFTKYGADSSRDAHRFKGKATLAGRAPLEAVLELKPDLLIVNNLVDPGYVARLREHHIPVFDLGHMRGLATLIPNIQAIGILIGAPERANAYAATLQRRMHAITQGEAQRKRPGALYLAVYADHLYGGAARTSYHDVLEQAGFVDVAAHAGLDGWPELTSERVLALDPDVLLTKNGMGAVLCRHAGLTQLRPCTGEGRVIELDGVMLDDPGPIMLDAAEALHDAYRQVEAK